MVRAVKQIVTIGPGGLIEFRRPDLPAGASAEVIVMIDSADSPPPPLSSLFGRASGVFASGDEADAFIRAERDRWGR